MYVLVWNTKSFSLMNITLDGDALEITNLCTSEATLKVTMYNFNIAMADIMLAYTSTK